MREYENAMNNCLSERKFKQNGLHQRITEHQHLFIHRCTLYILMHLELHIYVYVIWPA